jgi:hypothetical protein
MRSVHRETNKCWEVGCKGIIKKVSLRSRMKRKSVGRNLGEKSKRVRNHRMNRVNGSTDFPEVLD